MATLSNLLASWPKGMWESLIKIFYNGIPNYVWAIIVFTIVLKLILSPLDFLQRYSAAKTSRMQEYLKPEMDKLQKRYGTNPKLLQQKQAELYKKNNFNITGSCAVMFINLALTVVIFFTLYSGLGKISKFKISDQYEQLKTEYYNVLVIEQKDLAQKYIDEGAGITEQQALEMLTEEEQAQAEDKANQAVISLYEKIKDNWLWVRNVWRPDTQISVIPSFEDYVSYAGISYKDKQITDPESGEVTTITAKEQKEADKIEYNTVMGELISTHKGGNGYYILSVLAVLITFLSQFIMRWSQRPPKEKRKLMEQQGIKPKPMAGGWIMMVVMPLIMLFFTMTSSAMFSVYIIINSLMSTLLTPICTLIINKFEQNRDKKKQEAIKVDYRR